MKRLKSNASLVLLIFLLALAIYIGFEPLFKLTPEGVSREVLVAALGAIFVLFTTIVVLRAQTEQQTQMQLKINANQNAAQLRQALNNSQFSQKIKIYEKALKDIRSCIQNGKVTRENLVEMQFVLHELLTFASLSSTVSMLEIIREINEIAKDPTKLRVCEDENVYQLTLEDQGKLTHKLLEFDVAARSDIYNPQLADDDDAEIARLKDEISKSLEQITKEEGELVSVDNFNEFLDQNGQSTSTSNGIAALEQLRNIAHDFNPQLSIRITRSLVSVYNGESGGKKNVVMRVVRVTNNYMVLLTPSHHDGETRMLLLESANKKGFETTDRPKYKSAEIKIPLKYSNSDVSDLLKLSVDNM